MALYLHLLQIQNYKLVMTLMRPALTRVTAREYSYSLRSSSLACQPFCGRAGTRADY